LSYGSAGQLGRFEIDEIKKAKAAAPKRSAGGLFSFDARPHGREAVFNGARVSHPQQFRQTWRYEIFRTLAELATCCGWDSRAPDQGRRAGLPRDSSKSGGNTL
jgi:hypothetical protein